MIDFVLRNGSEYIDNRETHLLYSTAIDRFRDEYEVSPAYIRNIALVAGTCYDSEPLHQIEKQLEIIHRAKYDIIIIITSMHEHIEKRQCKTIRTFFEKHSEYEELTGVYNSKLVFAKIPPVIDEK